MIAAFDDFEFDSERRELRRGEVAVHLGPKAFRLLEILIASRPRAVRKEELYEAIWPDSVVEESNLAGLIAELRTALGDRARKPRFVRTVHGFGYAFSFEIAGETPPAAFVRFRGRDLPLRAGINILGRDASADVQIDDSTVSRRHAAIDVGPDSATIEDLASKNGTFIDRVKIDGMGSLTDGQSFVLGDASVQFRRSETAGSTASIARARKSKIHSGERK